MVSLHLTGEALALLNNFYYSGVPIRDSVYFRFNMDNFTLGSGDADLGGQTLDRYRINITPGSTNLMLFDMPEGSSDTFVQWINRFQVDPAFRGPADMPNKDGLPNSVKNFFGIDPNKSSVGIKSLAASNNAFSFTHPHNPNPAVNLQAVYKWSTDLVNYYRHGEADPHGTIITFSASNNDGLTTVTANVAGTPVDRLFVRIEVDVQ